jgi:hypothetical protein
LILELFNNSVSSLTLNFPPTKTGPPFLAGPILRGLVGSCFACSSRLFRASAVWIRVCAVVRARVRWAGDEAGEATMRRRASIAVV